MEDNKSFVTTEQTTADDYVVPEQDKPIYVPSGSVYLPQPESTSVPLDNSVIEMYNDRLEEIYGDTSASVSTEEDAIKLNESLDMEEATQKAEANRITIMDLAERGIPSSDIMRWYETTRMTGYAAGAGLYDQLKKSNVFAQMDDNSIVRSSYLDMNDQDKMLFDSLQNVPVNLSILNDMEVKATAHNNERGVLKRMAKGASILLPLDQERVALFNYSNIVRKHLGEYKEVKELSKLKDWNVNDLYTATRAALNRAASGPVEKFKQLVNDIDEDLLSQNITLGDRATFWQQVNDTTYSLNRFAFGADVVGLGFIGRTAAKAGRIAKLMSGSSLKASVATGLTAIQETVPVTSAFRGVNKTSKLGWQLLTGKYKKATDVVETLEKMTLANKVVDPAAYSESLKKNGEAFLRNTVYDAFSPNSLKSSTKVNTAKADMVMDASWGIEEAEDMNMAIQKAYIADEGTIKDLIVTAKKDAVSDFKYNLNELAVTPKNSTNSFNILSSDKGFSLQTKIGIGPNADKPFASVDKAAIYAKKFGKIDGEYKGFKTVTKADVAVDSEGAWVVIERQFEDGDKSVMLGDLVSSALKESKLAKGTEKQFSSGVLSGLGGANISADYTTRVLNNLKQADEGRMLSALRPEFTAVKKVGTEKPILNALMEQTRLNGQWYQVSALRQAGVSDKVIDAYRAIRRIEDAQYLTTAKAVYEGMLENGVKNIKYKGQRLTIGQKIDKPVDRAKVQVLTGIDDRGDEVKPILSMESPDKLNELEYTFVRTTEPLTDGGDSIVAIRNSDLLMIDPDVMNTVFSYKPGRMQFSPNTGFIKQVRTGKAVKLVNGKEKEETIINGIKTLFAHPDRFRVEEAAETLEGFRQLAIKVSKGEMTMDQAQIAIQNIKGWDRVGSFESFYALTQKGSDGTPALIDLDPRATLRYARDGEQLTFEGLPVKDFNYKGASATQYTNNKKVLDKKMRSDSKILNPFNFGDAPRLNADEELSLATGKIIRYATTDQYSTLYAQDYKKAFDLYLNPNKSALGNLVSPIENTNQIPENVLQRMKNAQNNYLRMMGRPTDADLFIERAVGTLVDKLFPDLKNASGSRIELYKSLASGNPIRAAKAMTFHWYLGMWNPRQLWMQASASFNALALSPKAGMWGTEMHLPIISYLQNGDKGAMYKLASKFDVNKKELLGVADIVKKLDVYTQSSHAGAFERTVSSQVKHGKLSVFDPTFFYLTGEYANRTLTAIIAAREAYLQGFRAEAMTAADFANLVVRQQNLYMNMGRAGTAEWQRGFPSFLTQFKGYQFRYLESMLDSTLTAGEKARLLLGQAIFGGTKGFVGPRYGAAIYNATVSDDTNTHPLADLAYHGLVDYISMSAGGNISFNDAFDVGLGQILDIAMEGNMISAPPAYSAMSKGVSAVTSVFESFQNYLRAPLQERELTSFMSVLAEDVAQGRGLPSSMNNALLGYLMFKTGQEKMANGALSREGVTNFEAAMKALGFSTLTSDNTMIAIQELDKLKQNEQEQDKLASRLAANLANAPTDKEREIRSAELRGLLQMLWKEDPELASKLERKVFNPKFLYDKTVEQRLNTYKAIIKMKNYERFRQEFRDSWDEYNIRKNDANKLQ